MAEFADYHRGNYSREIELSLGGTYKGLCTSSRMSSITFIT